ncbi:globin [Egicoccus sp. AB-alg6-2]|uniref:globin domain-containing protein n=1 Tax=Egicoccus sp. AB-alg6-2 TaxID=3242692 RepID=UPI00359EAB7F
MSSADDATPRSAPLEPAGVFERVGGMEAFEQLVEAFYTRVETDEVLRPQYPDDLTPGKRHLAMFLAQYWGGGDVYSSERGHPRLRMRHAPFDVTPEAALRWAQHMSAAIEQLRFPSDVEALLLAYVQRATPTLINRLPDDVVELPSDDARPTDG